MFTPRLRYALAAFAALFGLAAYLLEGKMLYAALLALGLFLFRTIMAARAEADGAKTDAEPEE